jgi:hypothetical protein
LQFVHLDRPDRGRTFVGEHTERSVVIFRCHGHRHVDEAIAGEDFERRAIGQNLEMDSAVGGLERGAAIETGEFLHLGVVCDRRPAHAQADFGRIAQFQLGADVEQLAAHVGERIVAGFERLRRNAV